MRLEPSLLWAGSTVRRGGWTIVVYAFLTILIVAPIIALVYASFRPADGDGFTLANYHALAGKQAREAALNTLIATVGATIGSVIVGGALAWLVERSDVPGKGIVQIAGVVPMFFSALVGALSWSLLGSPDSGYLNAVFEALHLPISFNVDSMFGITAVLTLYYSPFAFLLIRSALSIASGDLENAARMSGASAFRTTIEITFPLVAPAIAGAAILVFVIVSANFEVTEILGAFAHIDFLPGYVYHLVNSYPPQIGVAAAVGVVVLCVTWVAVWAESRYVLRRSYAAAGGKGARTVPVRLGIWRWPGFAFALTYIVLAAILPTCALLITAFRPSVFYATLGDLFDPDTFTTRQFVDALLHPKFQTGLTNSIILAILTTVFGTMLTFVIAYVAHRRSVYGSKFIEYIALAPVAIPGLILGLAFVSLWLRSPIPLYGTIPILVIAYICQLFPFSFENMSATLVKLDPDLEDSAVMAGASRVRAVISVTLPILRVALGAAALFLFVLAFREFTVALFLYSPGTIPLSVVIYEQWDSGSVARMASMALMFTAVLLVAATINYLVSRSRTENRKARSRVK
jgi:iron(III) transport system permease protein